MSRAARHTADCTDLRNAERFVELHGDDVRFVAAVDDPIRVVDVDPRNGGDVSLAALITEHGPLPLTPSARTGSGG